ncbi:sensor histidine kinase [Halobacillus salinus]|uniref:histidine kinase n=1 Tax=Halobacillus salinus TaxID=192814 RepID=A0A4Z0H057_9BACI|nr:sensor histidine kinase [Halobacillus salinus]TGB02900.1 HAMP domain-containing histidine kinase [Halobacillus salinus]
MIGAFLRERFAWILFFLAAQGLGLLLAFLDETLAFSSMLYFSVITLVAFLLFLAIRYKIETAFYRKLKDRSSDTDLTSLPEASLPMEQVVEETMTEELQRLKGKASQLQKETEEEKDEMMAWIHEVKTPLTTMNLIIQQVEDSRLKQSLKYEWLRIHLLLEQQLHQKRMPFMENDLYVETVDLKPLLLNEIKTLQSWCMQKGVGIDLNLKETEVLTDAKWVTFLIRQLLTNAVKYSEHSDLHISSTIRNDQVTLHVSDKGRGIDPKDFPRIFEKGFTSTVHHDDAHSTGMGLYLASKVAKVLKVDLKIESQPREGTTASLTFPKANEFTQLRGM